MKLTDWFDAEVNPVHAGVYYIDRGMQGKWFRNWTGTHWSLCQESVKEAAGCVMVSPAPAFPWCGIAR